MGTVYRFDDGFAVGVDEPPWTKLNAIVRLWPEKRMRNNRLGCVLVVYALLAEDMFKTMACLGDALLASFQGPPKALFNDHVYLRTDFSRHLHKLNDYASEQWIPAESALSELTQDLQQQTAP